MKKYVKPLIEEINLSPTLMSSKDAWVLDDFDTLFQEGEKL